jgi:hypothetical protein
MRRVLIVSVLCALGSSAHSAQQPSAPLRCEVASIKVQAEARGAEPSSSPVRFVRTRTSLRQLIEIAYDLAPFRVMGGPEWVGIRDLAVDATAASPASPGQMRVMLQRLLAERFALKTATRMQDMPVYFLRAARRDGQLGKQISRTKVDCAAIRAERLRSGKEAERPTDPNAPPVCTTIENDPLVADTRPLEVLVIDRIERPTEN